MKLTLNRIYKGETYTIGKLYINGEYFCDTIEDKYRGQLSNPKDKVYGKTAIPNGEYIIKMEHSPKFSPRFKGRLFPHILNVPCFEGILIHNGTTEADTLGCVIVGENKVKGKVINSTSTLIKLLDILDAAESEIIIKIS